MTALFDKRNSRIRNLVYLLLTPGAVIAGSIVAIGQQMDKECKEPEQNELDVVELPSWEEIKDKVAHDSRWDKPCIPSEADNDPDVAKRPCFRKALVRKRILGAGIFDFGIDVPEDRKVTREGIDDTVVERLWRLCATVLSEQLQPAKSTDVEWRGFKTYPNDSDLSHLACRWTCGGRTIGVRTRRQVTGGLITLRFTDKERLALNPSPGNIEGYWQKEAWEHLDKTKVHTILTTMLQFPFEKPDEFMLKGSAFRLDGVWIYSGRITSKYRENQYYLDGTDDKTLHWYDEARLFITDSDPQYFCVSVKMHKGDDRD